jgi:thiamine-monophosphate kinase
MTRLIDMGEFALHAWIKAALRSERGLLYGPGDDAALVDVPNGYDILISTDRASLPNLADKSGHYLGRFAVVQNFSDIICKGGQPTGFLLAALLERETEFSYYQDLITGAAAEAALYGAALLGGDTKENEVNTIVGVGVGLVKKGQAVSRAGAKPGDVIAVSLTDGNRIGWRWARVVLDSCEVKGLSSELVDKVENGYELFLKLPFAETRAAIETGEVTSCIDMSDGLGDSLRMICSSSEVACSIDEVAVAELVDLQLQPIAASLEIPMVKFAWSPGFDWENLFTIQGHKFADVREMVRSAGGDLAPIGVVTERSASYPQIAVKRANGSCSALVPFSGAVFKSQPRSHQAALWLAHPDYSDSQC